MGSKRWMLSNGLGHLLDELVPQSKRFVDLFAGSGAVSYHVASKIPIPVFACDLQKFSVILTRAVIGRRNELKTKRLWQQWHKRAEKIVKKKNIPNNNKLTQADVKEYRDWSERQTSFPITKAYGGHYFSPEQAIWIDSMRKTLPKKAPNRTVALAALIQAASQCAASPGHTAQPFQPTRTAKKFLIESWSKNIAKRTKAALDELSDICAQRVGRAQVTDANKAAKQLRKDDLVFIDPPYSGVHYSRFYHVLETIARGKCGPVSGVGRYPLPSKRPRSSYSVKTESTSTFQKLLETISKKNARAIVTFPDHECSNGLSGKEARKIAKKYFRVEEKTVISKFSTLGGTQDHEDIGNGRAARQNAKELILILSPRNKG